MFMSPPNARVMFSTACQVFTFMRNDFLGGIEIVYAYHCTDQACVSKSLAVASSATSHPADPLAIFPNRLQ